MSRIGDAIKAERELCDASQTTLARDARISREYLANIEAGRQLLPPETLLTIANQFMDVDTAEWLWLLLEDLWGEPIADLMKKHVVVTAATARAVRGGEG